MYSKKSFYTSSPDEGHRLQDEVSYIIQHLNGLTRSRFTSTSPSTIELIGTLRQKKYTVRQIKSVIDFKYEEWGSNDRMRKYLRPITLFDSYNFPRYLDEMSKKKMP
jgi:uncharacterized phage protein (TIGR02220 family)